MTDGQTRTRRETNGLVTWNKVDEQTDRLQIEEFGTK